MLPVVDVADSMWTFTVVAGGLRLAWSGSVHPFVLTTAIAS